MKLPSFMGWLSIQRLNSTKVWYRLGSHCTTGICCLATFSRLQVSGFWRSKHLLFSVIDGQVKHACIVVSLINITDLHLSEEFATNTQWVSIFPSLEIMLSFQKFTRAFWNESLQGDLVGTSGGPRVTTAPRAGAAAPARLARPRGVWLPCNAPVPEPHCVLRTNFCLVPHLISLLDFQTSTAASWGRIFKLQ